MSSWCYKDDQQNKSLVLILYVCRREGSVPVGQTKTGGASIAMVHSVPELVVSEQVRRPCVHLAFLTS